MFPLVPQRQTVLVLLSGSAGTPGCLQFYTETGQARSGPCVLAARCSLLRVLVDTELCAALTRPHRPAPTPFFRTIEAVFGSLIGLGSGRPVCSSPPWALGELVSKAGSAPRPFCSSLSSLSFIVAAGPCYRVRRLITDDLAQPEAARTGKGSAVRVSQLPLVVRRLLRSRLPLLLCSHLPLPCSRQTHLGEHRAVL